MDSCIDASNALEFYSNNNVIFLTGGTGFVGITVIEKILRSLPQVQKIYVLIRASGNSTVSDRLEEIATSRVFDTLRSFYSNEEQFRKVITGKIVPIQGDVGQDNLGISPKDMEMILSDTNIVIHSAASVQFDDPLYVPFNLNTRGTMRMLDIAKKMPNLASFVHVSTAFLIPNEKTSRNMEAAPKFLLGDPQEVYDRLKNGTKDEVEDFGNLGLKEYANTYSISKALTESLIHRRYNNLGFPVVIVRPTAVCSAMNEPFVGWCLGLGSLHMIVKSVGLGYLQEFAGDRTTKLDLVPIDYVVKTILSAGANSNTSMKSPLTFHVGTSHNDALLLTECSRQIVGYWKSAPVPPKRVSDDIRLEFYSVEELNKRFDQRFGVKLEHALKVNDEKTVKTLQWIYDKSRLHLQYFSKKWIFDMTNAISLDETAPFELRSGLKFHLDWDDYVNRICFGVHKYIMGGAVNYPAVNYELSRL